MVCLFMMACADSRNRQADIFSKIEPILSKGVVDYKKQNFMAAQKSFAHAMRLYQSVDDYEGVELARINLVETLLALNNFDAVETQLAILKQKKIDGMSNDWLKDRVILLEVKWLFQKQKYTESLAVIKPLLALEQWKNINHTQLNLLATAARLETLMGLGTEAQWLKKFRSVLLEKGNSLTKFQIILKRIDAVIATQKQQYPEALALLQTALDFYKTQADRRAIAACLEEMAAIAFQQDNQARVLGYLKRALNIRRWLKDQYHIDKINQRIWQINQS